MKKYTIGVDLGGTTITAGIVDETFKVLHKCTCDTNLPQPEEVIEEKIANLCRQVLVESNLTLDDLLWVGIGTPGSVNSKTGVVDFNANFGYYDWNLRERMEKRLGCKVFRSRFTLKMMPTRLPTVSTLPAAPAARDTLLSSPLERESAAESSLTARSSPVSTMRAPSWAIW